MNPKKIVIIIVIIFLILTLSKGINRYAVDFVANQKDRDNGIMIGAEPFTIERDPDTTVLLIHGTSSSPRDFVGLSSFLAKNNISSKAILLPGHGTHPKDLDKIKYEEWINTIDLELNNIKSKNKFLLGYSLGGTLSLKIAETKDLSGVISINAPIFLQSRYIPFIPILQLVQKYHVADPENIILATKEQRVAYDSVPLNTILEIVRTIEDLKLRNVAEPVLIIQTNNDTTVQPRSAEFIYNSISSEEKQLEWLEVSTHYELYEKEQEIMFGEIHDFIRRNSARP